MRALFFVFITVLLFSCVTTKGELTLLSLKKVDNKTWFFPEYNNYLIDTATLKEIPISFNNTNNSIEIFMGTWCSDSQRETPRIIKILEHLNFTNYKIYGLDTDKKSKDGFEQNKNITRVPTIIVYNNNNNEINRIVEYPVVSLEKDLLSILTHNNYSPNYSK